MSRSEMIEGLLDVRDDIEEVVAMLLALETQAFIDEILLEHFDLEHHANRG